MKTKLTLSVAIIALLGYGFVQGSGGSMESENQQYEYLTLEQYGKTLVVCSKSDGMNKIDIKDNLTAKPGVWFAADYSPWISKIESFESEGWELFSHVKHESKNCALMRRKKQ